MMNKILFLKGLPASGKSTYSKAIAEDGSWYRANKDDIRNSLRTQRGLNASQWNKSLEKDVEAIEYNCVRQSLENGVNVVIDNTHLDPRHEERYRKLAERGHWEFEVKFFDVPLETCLARNAKREGQARVPNKTIIDMYNRWLRPKPVIQAHNPNLADCIIVDLDGTLALFSGNPYDRDFENDVVSVPVRTVLNVFYNVSQYTQIIITSGRNAKFREVTEKWLADNRVDYDQLHMRAEKDNRPDTEVKLDMYNEHIKDKFNVRFVIDDRLVVVRMWVSMGLFVFNVNQENREF